MKYLWTMKNGQQIDVDQMSETHLRNALKMMIRNSQQKKVAKISNFEANFLEEAYKEYEEEFNPYY